MRKAVRAIFGAALVVAAATACNEDPTAEGRSDAEYFKLNPTVVTVNAGASVRVAAVIANRYGGSPFTAVTAEPCDSKITAVRDTARVEYQPAERFVVTAGNALGASCLIVKSGGVSDTAMVKVVPASLRIVGDSLLPSGDQKTYTVQFLTATGAAATGMSVADVNLSITPATAGTISATGVVTAQAPGAATITAALKADRGASRSATKSVAVVAGPFTGTVAQSAAPARGSQILTFTAGAVPFDSDTKLSIAGAVDSVTFLERTATTIIAAVPFGKPAGSQLTYTITNLGPNQLGVGGTFTTTAANLTDTWTGTDDPATAPTVNVGQAFVGLIGATGADEIYKVVVTEAGTYRLQVDWNNASDIDVYVANGAYTAYLLARETAANPEVGTVTLQPGTYFIELYMWESEADSQVFRVRFTKQ